MKEKIKKLLYEYFNDSRIKTKELGKRINSSQQSASYLLNSLKEKKLIQNETTLVDAVKLGYLNTFIGFNFVKMDYQTKNEIIRELINLDAVIYLEESREGFDLLVEVCIPNMAALDNLQTQIMTLFEDKLRIAFVFPVIMRKEYPLKYLRRKRDKKFI
jgi:DNA-binding Lrp family transcriptional regulator